MALVDSMVDAASSRGLYVILTIGGTGAERDFVRGFWCFYAPRYRDHSNVIYEVKNESWWASPPIPGGEHSPRGTNRLGYEAIRDHASQTPVLVYSYAFFENWQGVLEDMQWLQDRIAPSRWHDVGVAFHGYSGVGTTRQTVRRVRSSYPVMETEAAECASACDLLSSPWTPLLTVYERERTSWIAFQPLDALTDVTFNQPIEEAGLLWKADVGPFPAISNPPVGQTVGLVSPVVQKRVGVESNGQVKASFGSDVAATRFEVVAGPSGWVALKAHNGKYVRRTSGQYLYASSTNPRWFEWLQKPDGQISLQSAENWRFVAADLNVDDPPPLRANRTLVFDWESFELAQSQATPPTVTLLQPADGQVFPLSGSVVMAASASHPQNVDILRVDFHYGGSVVADSSAPYSRTFSAAGQSHGNVIDVFAVAYDANGQTAMSDVATVSFDGVAPSVSMTSPSPSATVSGTVNVTAAASDSGGVAEVQFLVDGVVRHTDTSPPYEFSWNTLQVADGSHSLRARARDGAGNQRTSTAVDVTVQNSTPTCAPTSTTLCLQNGRFEIRVSHGGGTARKLGYSEETGYFWFYNSSNVEVMVKILDGRYVNGYWWLYYGGMTDQAYTLTVKDMQTSQVRTFQHSAGNFCGDRTTQLFSDSYSAAGVDKADAKPDGGPESEAPDLGGFLALPAVELDKAGTCNPSDTSTLCLQNNRFAVSVSVQGGSRTGTRIPFTSESGFFWFFNSTNVDLGVKVLDGTTINGHWWFFYGSLSDVQYTITVLDTVTGNVATYNNNQGTYCGAGDVTALSGP